MLDFGFSEILLTSAIALVVLGPERLPKVARQVGNWMGRARSMARQLTEQLEREVSADDLLKEQAKAKAVVPNRMAAPATEQSQAAARYPTPLYDAPPAAAPPTAASPAVAPQYAAAHGPAPQVAAARDMAHSIDPHTTSGTPASNPPNE
jgi:sec-independent protein translocase protein TatB